tara:strand:- start:363 stop:1859 length:1497 start_codon:yes stop_codon:yes gene_type:complete
MAFIFKAPLIFKQFTGVTIEPNDTELFGKVSPSQTITFSIGQAVSSGSNVVFDQVTVTNKKITINDGGLVLSGSSILGSFTLAGSKTISSNLVGTSDLTVQGILTAEKIETELTQSVTLFESGSTQFGDTSDDTHQFSGSLLVSGSLRLNNDSIEEISNDTSMADNRSNSVITENAFKTYIDNNTNSFQTYLRKCFAHTGSFINSSTASFTATTASAPTGITTTTENDFMFFLNGQMIEHDALTIRQTGSLLHLEVDNDGVGYDLESTDEIVAWGKFESEFNYLSFDGSNDEVTTTFSGSSATPRNLTYSFWYNSTQTSRNESIFGYGGQRRGAFSPNWSSGRPLIWNGNNWYVFFNDTSAQDDGEWHHFLLFNDVNAITGSRLFVDGVEIGESIFVTSGTVSNLNTQSQPLTIGSYQNNSTQTDKHFSGELREFGIFDGDKSSKAALYYNGGTPYNLINEDDLQAYWRMNEGSGSVVNDFSGQGNHGTIDGATWDKE